MYYLIDTAAVPVLADKEDAFKLLADAKRDNPDAKWAVLGDVAEVSNHEQLELLYALTLQLLKVGKVNPLFIKVSITDLLGEEREITARQIINDARMRLDELDAQP